MFGVTWYRNKRHLLNSSEVFILLLSDYLTKFSTYICFVLLKVGIKSITQFFSFVIIPVFSDTVFTLVIGIISSFSCILTDLSTKKNKPIILGAKLPVKG